MGWRARKRYRTAVFERSSPLIEERREPVRYRPRLIRGFHASIQVHSRAQKGLQKAGDGRCQYGHPEVQPVHARALESRSPVSVWVGDHVGASPDPCPCTHTSKRNSRFFTGLERFVGIISYHRVRQDVVLSTQELHLTAPSTVSLGQPPRACLRFLGVALPKDVLIIGYATGRGTYMYFRNSNESFFIYLVSNVPICDVLELVWR